MKTTAVQKKTINQNPTNHWLLLVGMFALFGFLGSLVQYFDLAEKPVCAGIVTGHVHFEKFKPYYVECQDSAR